MAHRSGRSGIAPKKYTSSPLAMKRSASPVSCDGCSTAAKGAIAVGYRRTLRSRTAICRWAVVKEDQTGLSRMCTCGFLGKGPFNGTSPGLELHQDDDHADHGAHGQAAALNLADAEDRDQNV